MTSLLGPRRSHASGTGPSLAKLETESPRRLCLPEFGTDSDVGFVLRISGFWPTSSEFPASDSSELDSKRGEDRFLKRSSATCRRQTTRFRLGLAAVLLSLLPGLALRAQNPPADQKASSPPDAQSSTEKTPAKPSEKGKEPKTEGGQQLRLDNPEPAAAQPSQPTQQTPQNPQAKPAPAPPAAAPQKLQLETPKEAPAPQKAPELTDSRRASEAASAARRPANHSVDYFSRESTHLARGIACPDFLACGRRL